MALVRPIQWVPPPLPISDQDNASKLSFCPIKLEEAAECDNHEPMAKRSRYLREVDRRAILARLARGERQAALAKEFRVSRAAICSLHKHREAVLSRQGEHPLAQHPKRRVGRKSKRAASQEQQDAAQAELVERPTCCRFNMATKP